MAQVIEMLTKLYVDANEVQEETDLIKSYYRSQDTKAQYEG